MPPKTTCMKRLLTFVRRCVPVAILVAICWSAYGCGDTASISNGPAVRLASLAISPGALSPAFSPTTTNYTVNVPATTTTVTVTATPEDSTATVVITGGATQSLPGPGSSKDITIVVTAQSGSQSTYIVTVNKAALAADNNLSALTVAPGALSPAFASGIQNYTVDVATDVTSVSVSATKSDPNAVISGDVPNEGQAMILLGGPGTTTNVLITVTAQDGSAETYRITVNRAAPANNNNLSALSVDAGSCVPTLFAGDRELFSGGFRQCRPSHHLRDQVRSECRDVRVGVCDRRIGDRVWSNDRLTGAGNNHTCGNYRDRAGWKPKDIHDNRVPTAPLADC